MEAIQSEQIHKKINQLPRTTHPVKVLQFGSGIFLRGFVDWMLQELNAKSDFDAGVCVVQSISQSKTLEDQEGVFTVILKGIKDDEFVSKLTKVDVIQRVVFPLQDFESYLAEAQNPDLQFIISNTTEAGIQFVGDDNCVTELASSFPGKLTQLLYRRFQHNLNNKLTVLPTELIENNGAELKSVILKYVRHWSLPYEFTVWLNEHVTFCNTLVDRIISGFPKKPKEVLFDELGYEDNLAVEAEWFHLWVIEGPRWVEEILPLRKAGFNVVFTHDLTPYRIRKVRILNGAHTGMAVIGRQMGILTVRDAIEDALLGKFLRRLVYDEIVPHIPGDLQELERYADEVINRFRNPAIDHKLEAISLNSFSKFKVRVLTSLIDNMQSDGRVPKRLSFILASLLYYYRALNHYKDFVIKDSEDIIELMKDAWIEKNYSEEQVNELCVKVLSSTIWGFDFMKHPLLISQTSKQLYSILSKGITETLKQIESENLYN